MITVPACGSGHGPTSRQGIRTATAISATFGHEPGVGIAAESAGGGWTHRRASVEVGVAFFASNVRLASPVQSPP